MGKYQARVVADVIRGRDGITAWADHRAVPSVVFTDPQVGSVGWSEARARDEGIDYVVIEPHGRAPNIRPRGYGENFATDRKGQWTH